MATRVCVIGGGISGLTAAYLLKQKGFDTTLFESSTRVGGNISSERKGDYVIEHGPNSLLRSPRLVELINALGLRSRVVGTSAGAKERFVLIDGQLKALPSGLASFASGGFFSRKTKLRLLAEPFFRSAAPGDETVAGFFERRLGREVVDKAVDPFISGIYAGDPAALSMRHAFPAIANYERDRGSILLGAILSKREKVSREFPRSFSFQNGLSTLTERLAETLDNSLIVGRAVKQIERRSGGFAVSDEAGGRTDFDAVVISTKADAAADIVEHMDKDVARELRSIYYSPVVVVRSAYPSVAVGESADGFGFLVPKAAARRILGSLWTSSVFAGRAPQGTHLFTTFIGGARAPHLCELDNAQLKELTHAELADIMKISADPIFTDMTRWPKAIPQYNIGYGSTVGHIERFTAANPGIFICSNFYRGISVGDCVKNAYRTADDVEKFVEIQE